MKLVLLLLSILLLQIVSFAQTYDKSSNSIDVQGSARLSANPENYVAQILIQEEEQKVGYTTIGKLSIDSVKINLFSGLKKFNIEEKDLKMLGVSSKEIGQYPNFLTNVAYEVKLKDKDAAYKLVSDLKFTGLKGVVIKRSLTKSQKETLSDSLYSMAINDARRIAAEFAKRSGKSVGEVKSIEFRYCSINVFGMGQNETNSEPYNIYGYNRFEMDLRDRFENASVRVNFELK